MGYGGTILIPRSPHGERGTNVFIKFRQRKHKISEKCGWMYQIILDTRKELLIYGNIDYCTETWLSYTNRMDNE
jgi:hypothetical protein